MEVKKIKSQGGWGGRERGGGREGGG